MLTVDKFSGRVPDSLERNQAARSLRERWVVAVVFRVRITAVGEQTALPPSCGSLPLHRLLDLARKLLLTVRNCTWAVASGCAYLATDDVQGQRHALIRTATFLVVAYPAHLSGLAVPLVIAISTSLGAGKWTLRKEQFALEQDSKLDMVVSIRPGTLRADRPPLSGSCERAGWQRE